MINRQQEAALFDGLMRNRQLRDWLDAQMAEQVKVLLVNPDGDAIKRTQGAAGFIKLMQDKIAAAETSARR